MFDFNHGEYGITSETNLIAQLSQICFAGQDKEQTIKLPHPTQFN